MGVLLTLMFLNLSLPFPFSLSLKNELKKNFKTQDHRKTQHILYQSFSHKILQMLKKIKAELFLEPNLSNLCYWQIHMCDYIHTLMTVVTS